MKLPEALTLLDETEVLINKATKTRNKIARKTFMLRASIQIKPLLDDFLNRYLGYLPEHKKQSARRSLLSTAGLYETQKPAPHAPGNKGSIQNLSSIGKYPGSDADEKEIK